MTIPTSHTVGEIERPKWSHLQFSEDPAKHIALASLEPLEESQFLQELKERVATQGTALIFVHGYNVKFADAARRTAQIAYDLKFHGVPMFFSWPSTGTYFGYPEDEDNVVFAVPHLKQFIENVAATQGVKSIYLIAHSMGTRALTQAVAELSRDKPAVGAKLREVILAAPDIDAQVFKRDIVPAIAGADRSVTLYASSRDMALLASKKWHGNPRAGDSGASLVVANGVSTIDSSDVDTGLLGHTYFAEAGSIIADILAILAGQTDPGKRPPLVSATSADGTYWKMPAHR